MGKARNNCTRHSRVQFTALQVLLIQNTTANHAITYWDKPERAPHYSLLNCDFSYVYIYIYLPAIHTLIHLYSFNPKHCARQFVWAEYRNEHVVNE